MPLRPGQRGWSCPRSCPRDRGSEHRRRRCRSALGYGRAARLTSGRMGRGRSQPPPEIPEWLLTLLQAEDEKRDVRTMQVRLRGRLQRAGVMLIEAVGDETQPDGLRARGPALRPAPRTRDVGSDTQTSKGRLRWSAADGAIAPLEAAAERAAQAGELPHQRVVVSRSPPIERRLGATGASAPSTPIQSRRRVFAARVVSRRPSMSQRAG